MADRTDDLLISVSTDLTTIKRQLKQLGQDIGQTTSGIQKQFDGLGKGIDQSLTPIQKRINDMMGIASTGAKPLKEWKGALADAANGLDKTSHAASGTSASMQAMLHSVRSVGEQLALGISPTQALTGQLSHLSFVASQPGGITAAFGEIKTKALAMIAAFPEVAIAVGVAAAAFIAYETLGGNNIKSLDEILKTHEANIKRLGDAYDEVAGKQHKYASDTANTVNALNEKSVKDIKAALGAQLKGVLDDLYKTIGAGGGNQGPLSKSLISTFEPFRTAIEKLAEGARNGTPDVKAFRDEVTNLAKADPKNLDGTRDVLLGLTAAAADTAASLPVVTQAVSGVVDTVAQFQQMVDGISSKPLQKELEDLFAKAKDGTESLDEINQALARLEQANPDFSSIIASIGKIIIAARNASDAVNSVYANSGGSPNGRHESPQRVPDGVEIPIPSFPNKEDLGASSDKAAAAYARKHRFHAPKITADDQFSNDLQAIKDRTAALNEEMAALGLSYEEQTKRKTALDLEQQALKQVREEARKKGDADWQNAQLSPQQIAQIDAVSEAYARQADALKKAQEMQQLQQDLLKGAFDDLRSALDDGKLDWQDFQKIALNALDKIIDKIENDLIDSIMQANSASGGGGLGSILSFLTGSGSSGAFPAAPSGGGTWGGVGLWDTGGYTGPGGKKDVAGLVHKGEVVFSQDDIARNGGVAAVEALRRGRAISAPQMPSINAPARGGDTSVTFAPVISVQGGGNDAGEQVTAALKKFDREFTPKVVKAIKEAKTRGMV
jgi:hypothetical protein